MANDARIGQLVERREKLYRRALVIDARESVASPVARRLADSGLEGESPCLAVSVVIPAKDKADPSDYVEGHDVVVFSPLRAGRRQLVPSADYAQAVLAACRDRGAGHLVLVSSAEIYGSDYSNPGMVRERRAISLRRRNGIAATWAAIESLADRYLHNSQCRLTIVRPCFILSGDRRDYPCRLFRSRLVFPLAGYDPCMQFLGVTDFAAAIAAIVKAGKGGIYHVAPRDAIPLRKALRLAGARSLPVPYSLQYAARLISARLGLAVSMDQVQFLRYPWTVSGRTLKNGLGVEPGLSSAEVIAAFRGLRKQQVAMPPPTSIGQSHLDSTNIAGTPTATIDGFGMDTQYIRRCGRRQFQFLEKVYWRVECDGLERIPQQGGAVLAGIHRGFMPLDGVMMVHLMSTYVGRVPRFLMHPGLVKFPYLSRFLTRLGGMIACRENADHVLEQQEIVGIFPEGIRGAFRMYGRDIYKIGKPRDDYVKAALRHRVPIIPFVAVGPAEIFPIFAKIKWAWWKRHTHWPFFPITPTGNLIPLPAKWHIQVLDPISTDEYGPYAAENRAVVSALSHRVRHQMQSAINDMLSRRRSIFFGSLFGREPAKTKQPRRTAPDALAPSGAMAQARESA